MSETIKLFQYKGTENTMKKLFAIIFTLCVMLPMGGCAMLEIFPTRPEREIAEWLIYTPSAPDGLLLADVIAYDPERYTYYVELTCGSVLALTPGRIEPACRCTGKPIRCDAEKINRELARYRKAR